MSWLSVSHAATHDSIYLPIILAAAIPAMPNPTSGPLVPTADEQEVLRLTNELRRSVGCGPLTADPLLVRVAAEHSSDMAITGVMSHTGSDGSSPWDRTKRLGYVGAIGENIAAGYVSAADVFAAWRTSKGHYANLANCSFRDTGVSAKRSTDGTIYWTQVFGARQQ